MGIYIAFKKLLILKTTATLEAK